MVTKNPSVDLYLKEGCGRCSHYQTPECKVHNFPKELKLLRKLVLECGLKEEYKWSQPCYTYQGNNILIVTAFVNYSCISFFKGSLLKDPDKILTAPGKRSQAARQIRFTDPKEIKRLEPKLKKYVVAAIEIEKAGKKVEFKKEPEAIPPELAEKFGENPKLKNAFEALTPGRQRGYIIHFSDAKQSATRTARIEKSIPKIMKGLGFFDR